MEKLVLTSMIILGIASSGVASTSYAAAEVKEVCHDKMDKKGQPVKGKDGKAVQDCKKIKVHKKLEGTPIPEKSAKK